MADEWDIARPDTHLAEERPKRSIDLPKHPREEYLVDVFDESALDAELPKL